LSNSVAFRVLGSSHTSVAEAQALGTIHPIGMTQHSDRSDQLSVDSTEDIDSKLHFEKQKSLAHSKRRKIPLIASIAVSCRVELYQDLLSAQISATAGKVCSDTIFATNTEWKNQTNRSSLHRSSEYIFTPDQQIVLLEIICKFVVALGKEIRIGSDALSPLQSVRHNIRFHVLQYLLGLDKRWSFEQTMRVCQMILKLLEKYRPMLVDFSVSDPGPFRYLGKKSRILTPAALNIIARVFPEYLLTTSCSVRYSLLHQGASLMTLLKASESKPYKACLLVVQDSAGYVFGGFLEGQLFGKNKEYFGTGSSFVFRALPNTKIYPWTRR
jgi:hypothetical protein